MLPREVYPGATAKARRALRALEAVSAVTGIAISLFDLDGNRLFATGWRPICTDFHRACPTCRDLCDESDRSYASRLAGGAPFATYECGNGLMLCVAPVHEGGEIAGGLVVSQFLLAPPDEGAFLARAEKHGFDPEAYLAALREVTVLDSTRLSMLIEFLVERADWMSGSDSLRQYAQIKEILDREFLLTEAQTVARLGYYVLDIATGRWSSSPILDQIFGIDPLYDHDVSGWLGIVHEDDRSMMADYFQTEVLGRRLPFDKEYRVTRVADGETRWVHGMGRLDFNLAGAPVRMIGTIQDITDQREARDATERSLALYHDLVETSQDLIWQCDSDGRYTYLNPAWQEVMGYSAEEMLGKSFADFQSEEYAVRDLREFSRLLSGGIVRGYETVHLAKDGREVELLFNAKFLMDETGAVAGTRGTAYDVTERNRVKREIEVHRRRLGELAADLLSTRERERHRIAVNLHDEVGQMLVAAKMLAQQLCAESDLSPQRDDLSRLVGLLDLAVDEIRALTSDLTPLSLYELGIGPALRGLAETFLARYGLQCELRVDPDVAELSNEAGALMFRTVRELLNNVQRHSGARSARVHVLAVDGYIVARVEDDGCGFDTAITDQPESRGFRFGLLSIREEAALANGSLSIASEPGRGTSAEIWIPACSTEPNTERVS